jgi:hypothetical protein
MFSSGGWSVPGLIREFGAEEVFTIEKFAGTITVEAWSATDRCIIREKAGHPPVPGYATMLQVTPQVAG